MPFFFTSYLFIFLRCDDYRNNFTTDGNVTWPLKAYAACLNDESKFFYTIAFLLLPLVFYLTEFLTLRDEYEPTGFRQRIVVSKSSLFRNKRFMLDEMLQRNVSKFAILLEYKNPRSFCSSSPKIWQILKLLVEHKPQISEE